MTFRVRPCDLLIDIAKQTLMGNCSCLNWNGKSVGIRGILGINTSSPSYCPIIIVASRTFGFNLFTTNQVPLHNFGG